MIIYKVTNVLNGKVYIGQSRHSLEFRKWQHLNKAHKHVNTHLYNAMNKYGYENFKFEVIDDSAKSSEELNQLEIYYIGKYDSIATGYNMICGGHSNIMDDEVVYAKHSAKMRSTEVRNKISESMKEYHKLNPVSAITRGKLRELAYGNKRGVGNPSHSVACYCIDANGVRHDFTSYKNAGVWWFEYEHPFGDKYHQVTYQRKIISCIDTGSCFFKGKRCITDLNWYRA